MSDFVRNAIHNVADSFGYSISKKKVPYFVNDEKFEHIFAQCKDYTMVSKEGAYALFKAIEYIVKFKIPGDFVECGVWRGGCVMIILYVLHELGETNRKVYLYDTFEGTQKPGKEDFMVGFPEIRAIDEWKKGRDKKSKWWCYSSLSEVQENIRKAGYPTENIIFVKGRIEDTFIKTAPNTIALLRLDTDWYESTKYELVHLFPLLSKSGVLIVDDYDIWAGAKKATDEYFQDRSILLNRIQDGGRIAIKT